VNKNRKRSGKKKKKKKKKKREERKKGLQVALPSRSASDLSSLFQFFSSSSSSSPPPFFLNFSLPLTMLPTKGKQRL
jgi:hypothetical protein